jgi:hypothetical protein
VAKEHPEREVVRITTSTSRKCAALHTGRDDQRIAGAASAKAKAAAAEARVASAKTKTEAAAVRGSGGSGGSGAAAAEAMNAEGAGESQADDGAAAPQTPDAGATAAANVKGSAEEPEDEHVKEDVDLEAALEQVMAHALEDAATDFAEPPSQVNTLPIAKSQTRSKQNKDKHKCSSVYSKRGVPLPVLTSGGE